MMIQMHLLNIQTLWMMFTAISIITIQKKRKILIVFDDMIVDIKPYLKNYLLDAKLNIYLVFITQSYFSVPKEVRFNSTHYLIMKIHNKGELQTIAIDHSADIDYKDFLNIYRNFTKEPYSFLTIYTTLPADNAMKFGKNFSDSP